MSPLFDVTKTGSAGNDSQGFAAIELEDIELLLRELLGSDESKPVVARKIVSLFRAAFLLLRSNPEKLAPLAVRYDALLETILLWGRFENSNDFTLAHDSVGGGIAADQEVKTFSRRLQAAGEERVIRSINDNTDTFGELLAKLLAECGPVARLVQFSPGELKLLRFLDPGCAPFFADDDQVFNFMLLPTIDFQRPLGRLLNIFRALSTDQDASLALTEFDRGLIYAIDPQFAKAFGNFKGGNVELTTSQVRQRSARTHWRRTLNANLSPDRPTKNN